MKRTVQSVIRRLHVMAAGDLPARLSIYLHDLPERDWDSLRAAVAYLRGEDYTFTDPIGLCQPGTDRRVFLSFDDCFRSWWQALPLFDELQLNVTFYLNTEPFRDLSDATTIRNYLGRISQDDRDVETISSGELKELAAAGHIIGAHGHTHRDLAALPSGTAQQEILICRDKLQEIVGTPVVHFSFPYGMRRNSTEHLRRFCLSNGFVTVANAIPGLLHGGQRLSAIQRTGWSLEQPISHNVDNLRIDGRWFEKLTGRTAAPF